MRAITPILASCVCFWACAFNPAGLPAGSDNDAGATQADGAANDTDAGADAIDGGAAAVDAGAMGTPDGAQVQSPDASPPPDDATPVPDAAGFEIPCGPMTCSENCCFDPNDDSYECNVLVCIEDLWTCDGQEDCGPGQDCCYDGSDTTCAPEGTCPLEVCHQLSECTDSNDDSCDPITSLPFGICYDD